MTHPLPAAVPASRRAAALMLGAAVLGLAVARPAHAQAQTQSQPDRWQPLRRLVGEWAGTVTGRAGDGTVTRSYRFVMNERYLHEVNVSRYPPQERNKAGEVHEHWSMFSHDRARNAIVLRQFHVEGFVNTYRLTGTADAAELVFDSEGFENFNNAWKACESYRFVSDDEFVETFELAPPDKPFQVYSRNHFRRAPR